MTTVLVCELNDISAAGIESVLKLAACKVVRRCRSADEMLRLAGLHRPEIVVADSRTLGDGAIATFRKLQLDHRGPRIILLVETNPGTTAADLDEFNADGLLLRYASAATMVECVKCVREGRHWLDPDLLHHLACPEPTMATTDNLTSRERLIMHLVALGMPNKEIARQATLTEGTVKMHVHHILVKLRLTNRTQLAAFAHSRSQQPSHSRAGPTVKLGSLLSSGARSFQQAPTTSRALITTDRRGR
jgi:DNA-binding NarL/FixJ family response regulator